MEASKPQQQDFIKKRQQFSKNIRKTNREELLSKRRNVPTESVGDNQLIIDYLIDPRYAEYIKKFQKTPFNLSNLQELSEAITSSDIIQQHYAVIGIRRILSLVDDPPIQPIIDCGLIPKLIEFMNQDEYPQLQLESAWALANVASGTYAQCQSIIDKGVIQIFVKLLKSPHLGIVEQAIWAIGNIASDSSFNRDAVIRKGAITALVCIVTSTKLSQIIEPGLWALSNLCRGQPYPPYDLIREAIIAIAQLMPVMEFKEQSVFGDCCWALSYSFPKKAKDYELVVTPQLIEKLVTKLREVSAYEIIVPVVRICGNITRMKQQSIDLFLRQEGIMQVFDKLLSFPRKVVRVQTCWVLSNIVYGNQKHVEAIISNENIISKILELFQSDEKEVQRQICVFFSNICEKGSPSRVYTFLKELNIMKYYVTVLTNSDTRVQKEALESMHTVMQLGEKFKQGSMNPFSQDLMNLGASTHLQQLQMSVDTQVYEAVVKVMRDFFDVEGEDLF